MYALSKVKFQVCQIRKDVMETVYVYHPTRLRSQGEVRL